MFVAPNQVLGHTWTSRLVPPCHCLGDLERSVPDERIFVDPTSCLSVFDLVLKYGAPILRLLTWGTKVH